MVYKALKRIFKVNLGASLVVGTRLDRKFAREIDGKLLEKQVQNTLKHLPDASPEYPEIAYKPPRPKQCFRFLCFVCRSFGRVLVVLVVVLLGVFFVNLNKSSGLPPLVLSLKPPPRSTNTNTRTTKTKRTKQKKQRTKKHSLGRSLPYDLRSCPRGHLDA